MHLVGRISKLAQGILLDEWRRFYLRHFKRASHRWRQRMKEPHMVWPAVMKVAVSALALFATLTAVFPALRLVIRKFFFGQ